MPLLAALWMGCSYDSSADFTDASSGAPGPVLPCAAPPCQDRAECSDPSECASGRCEGGVCQPSAVNDGVKNGAETDIDCGGPAAPRCADSQGCIAGSDCASLSCQSGRCAAPSSTDGVKNGNETDVDCGGGAPGCAAGRACVLPGDCLEGFCPAPADPAAPLLCVTPTATDGIKNGNESDVDCGRLGEGFDTAAPGCAMGAVCLGHSDCASNGCNEEGPLLGRCADAPSCTMNDGGHTCGAGEIADDAAPGPGHESCCQSLPVPGFTDPAYPGKTVTLDKYEITAGRMRKFVERIAADNAGIPRVRSWLGGFVAAHPGMRWNDTPDPASNWTRWLPENTGGRFDDADLTNWNSNAVLLFPQRGNGGSTPGVPAGSYGNVGTDFLFGQGGYYFYVHGHNCDGGTGYASYWYPDALMTSIHNGNPRALSRVNLDRRAMNCAPLAMFAAFCAWDGGQLATAAVLSEVTGVPHGDRNDTTGTTAAYQRLAASAQANYTNDAGNPPTQYNVPPIALEAARVAPPGRMTGDKVEYMVGAVAAGPWMDMRGNLQESAILETAEPLTFAGVHYDGLGRNSSRPTRDTQARYAEFKAATVGARCMRYRDP